MQRRRTCGAWSCRPYLSSLGSAGALEPGQFSSEGTGLLLAQVVGSVSLLGKGISGLSSALFGDDGKDLGNVLAHGTHFGELNLGGRSDLAHTEGSEFFTVPLELLDTSGLVF